MWVGKRFHFDAAHHLPGHPTCGEVHGHTWTVSVQVYGPVDPKSGMVIDFKTLSAAVKAILAPLDHTNLNPTIPVPTCEGVARYIATSLLDLLPPKIQEAKVTVQEGTGGWATHTERSID